MYLMTIKQVREIKDTTEVNRLLNDNWILLTVGYNNGQTVFVMGTKSAEKIQPAITGIAQP